MFLLYAGSGDSGVSYDTVDIFNITADKWSTASLSAARGDIAATSLPNLGVAIFAGGGGMLCDFFFLLLRIVAEHFVGCKSACSA